VLFRSVLMSSETTAPHAQPDATARVRPMTGDEYLDSIRDNRKSGSTASA